jgi:glycosyltransferase involved in cell wall biosynthesis
MVNQRDEGGATAACRELATGLAARGVEVSVLPRAGGVAELEAEVASFRPEILHVHCWYQAYDYGLLAEWSRRLPAVLTVHDVAVVNQFGIECWECYRNPFCLGCPALPPLRRWRPNHRVVARWRKRRANRRTDVVLVLPSRWMRRRLARTEWAERPVVVIPYGIDVDAFHGRQPPDQVSPGASLLFVGNMYSGDDHRKGLPDLLHALGILRRRGRDLRLVVAGRIAGLEPPPGVEFRGEIPRESVAALYAGHIALVAPSRGDNLPLAVLEAMASGLPVIGARVGGLPEEIGEGPDAAGLLVPPDSPWALARAIERLVLDPEARRRFGEAGRVRARTLFSRETCVQEHLGLYERLLAQRSGAP